MTSIVDTIRCLMTLFSLFSLIFIVDGLKKILGVYKDNILWTSFNKNDLTTSGCTCIGPDLLQKSIVAGNSTPRSILRDNLMKNLQNKDWTDANKITEKTDPHLWGDVFRRDYSPFLYAEGIDGETNQTEYRCLYKDRLNSNNNETDLLPKYSNFNQWQDTYSTMSLSTCQDNCGYLKGDSCKYTRDVFLFSLILSFGTFILATTLKNFKFSTYFPTRARSIISDFGVTAAIVIMISVDYLVDLDTPKLAIPQKFEPTIQRNWIVNIFDFNDGNSDKSFKFWHIFLAIIPAIPALILVFLDQQITAVIVNRKENKLRKGAGYHLDLLVVAVMIGICSIFGLPWFVAATVLSITHVNSLKRESGVRVCKKFQKSFFFRKKNKFSQHFFDPSSVQKPPPQAKSPNSSAASNKESQAS